MSSPENPVYYRHLYGGIYRFITEAYHSDDASEMVVYEQVWPFSPSTLVRPKHEFCTRFSPIDSQEVELAMRGDRQAAQQAVNAAKAAARAGKT